jgi:hypothetical protein
MTDKPQALSETTVRWISDIGSKLDGWQWMGHFTFAEPLHPEQANKRFSRFVRAINRDIYGRRYGDHGQGIYWVRGQEDQRREAIHYHALLGGGVKALRRLTWMDKWYEMSDGICRIWPCDGRDQAIQYITKYQLKGGEVDIFVPQSRIPEIHQTEG